MKTRKFFAYLLMPAMALMMYACSEDATGDDPVTGGDDPVELSSEAAITAFEVTSGDEVITGTIYDYDKVVELSYLPEQEAILSSLTATYSISEGATIAPDPASVSDYSSAVSFVVTAEDGTTTATWTVEAVEAVVVNKIDMNWQKTFGDLGTVSNRGINDGAIAFSGTDIVMYDGRVYDLEGTYLGELNFDDCYNSTLVSMTNDDNGVLIATIAVYTSDDGFGSSDAISYGAVMAWKDGWASAPTKIYENSGGDVTRFIHMAGDVNGAAVLTILGPSRGATQMHHVMSVTDGDWDNTAWAGPALNYASNDGCWTQQLAAASADVDGAFFIMDNQSSNAGVQIYTRTGIYGEDTALNGTMIDDGYYEEAEFGGSNQYGNYTYGHIFPFQWYGEDYVCAATSGWAAAYFTIQPADANNNDYLLRTQMFANGTPMVSTAYVFDEANDCGYAVLCSANYEVVLYKLYRETI